MINFRTEYWHLAGQTVPWLPSDSQEKWNHNLKHRRDLLAQQGWLPEKTIAYQFNSHGFRSDEFDNSQDTCVFLGCSFTTGIGLDNQDIFPTLVSASLGMKSANLGIGGASMDTAFRMGVKWIPTIKPKIVVCLQPYPDRIELVNNRDSWRLMPNFDAVPAELIKWYHNYWLIEESNSELNRLKNTWALKHLCREHNIKFVCIAAEQRVQYIDRARDLEHPGAKSHQLLAADILTLINKQ